MSSPFLSSQRCTAAQPISCLHSCTAPILHAHLQAQLHSSTCRGPGPLHSRDVTVRDTAGTHTVVAQAPGICTAGTYTAGTHTWGQHSWSYAQLEAPASWSTSWWGPKQLETCPDVFTHRLGCAQLEWCTAGMVYFWRGAWLPPSTSGAGWSPAELETQHSWCLSRAGTMHSWIHTQLGLCTAGATHSWIDVQQDPHTAGTLHSWWQWPQPHLGGVSSRLLMFLPGRLAGSWRMQSHERHLWPNMTMPPHQRWGVVRLQVTHRSSNLTPICLELAAHHLPTTLETPWKGEGDTRKVWTPRAGGAEEGFAAEWW